MSVREALALVRQKEPLRVYVRETPLFYAGIASLGNPAVKGVGVHLNLEQALFSALVEFLERYALSSRFGADALIRSSIEKLLRDGVPFVDPVPEFSTEKITGREEIGWVYCDSLGQDQKILLPAQSVLWDYDVRKLGEFFICEPNVNGAACAKTQEEALSFGMYEAIERDAFLMHWLKMITPPRVDVAELRDPEFQNLADLAQKQGLKLHILDITSDIPVPSFMVALVDERARLVHRGFSANLNPVSAIKKAFFEAWGNFCVNAMLRQRTPGAPPGTAPYVLERYRLWARPEAFGEFEFLLRGPLIPFRSGNENPDELAVLKAILAGKGLAAYYYAPQHPLLGILGLFAAKVVIPGLIPLYLDEENARAVFRHLRLDGAVKNTFPHPFG